MHKRSCDHGRNATRIRQGSSACARRGDRAALCLLAWLLPAAGCARALPPEIPEFVPFDSWVIELPEIVVAGEEGEPMPYAAEAPQPEAPTEAPEAAPAALREAVPSAEETAKNPPAKTSIVGTWRVTEMSHNGRQVPDVEQIQMTLTFAEGGTMTMTAGHPQMPEPMSRSGTYSLSGNRITMTIEGDAKTGTYSLEGNQLTLQIEEARLVMTRS